MVDSSGFERVGMTPICISEESYFHNEGLHIFKKRSIYWKEESDTLRRILKHPEKYNKTLDLLNSG